MSIVDLRSPVWLMATALAVAAGQIKVGVELVTTPVTVRDSRGRFVPDLRHDEFELYEDGVRQTIVTFFLTHGGRIYNVAQPLAPPALEGLLLPQPLPTRDASGRIIVIFVDDRHFEPSQTPRVRELFGRITEQLIHEGDLFGVLSTGTSSIEIALTYDRRRLNEAKNRISGNGLRPRDVLDVPAGAQGPPEVRHHAHVAFTTAYDLKRELEKVRDRRKVLVYISNGYDLDPFAQTRTKREAERLPESEADPFRPQTDFSEADLVSQLSEVTRAAERANVSIFTIDPRGLTAGPDISEPIDMVEYQKYVSRTQDSLRVLAEQTGGRAIVNRNDFDRAVQFIDAETSDYYMVGYYSSNRDPTKRRRTIDIKVRRPNVDVRHRTEYTLKGTAR
jgi:VWFA-related protein